MYSPRYLLRYGPPIVLETLGLYTLWWSVEVDGEAAVKGYILGVIQVVCATIMLTRLGFADGKHQAAEELREIHAEVAALRDALDAQGVIELINGNHHPDRLKIHLVETRPKE